MVSEVTHTHTRGVPVIRAHGMEAKDYGERRNGSRRQQGGRRGVARYLWRKGRAFGPWEAHARVRVSGVTGPHHDGDVLRWRRWSFGAAAHRVPAENRRHESRTSGYGCPSPSIEGSSARDRQQSRRGEGKDGRRWFTRGYGEESSTRGDGGAGRLDAVPARAPSFSLQHLTSTSPRRSSWRQLPPSSPPSASSVAAADKGNVPKVWSRVFSRVRWLL